MKCIAIARPWPLKRNWLLSARLLRRMENLRAVLRKSSMRYISKAAEVDRQLLGGNGSTILSGNR